MTYSENKVKADKRLRDDKEYLQRCLKKHPMLDAVFFPISEWWNSDSTVLTVAKILDRYGQLKDIPETIDFFEKPYNFEEKMKFIVENM
jgi:hypothetical protein